MQLFPPDSNCPSCSALIDPYTVDTTHCAAVVTVAPLASSSTTIWCSKPFATFSATLNFAPLFSPPTSTIHCGSGLSRPANILLYSWRGDSHCYVALVSVSPGRGGWRDGVSTLLSIQQGKRDKHAYTCESHGMGFIPLYFSTMGSFGPQAERLLSCICWRLISHVHILEWEAHDWVLSRLSFAAMCKVDEQLVGWHLADFSWWFVLAFSCSRLIDLFYSGHEAQAFVVVVCFWCYCYNIIQKAAEKHDSLWWKKWNKEQSFGEVIRFGGTLLTTIPWPAFRRIYLAKTAIVSHAMALAIALKWVLPSLRFITYKCAIVWPLKNFPSQPLTRMVISFMTFIHEQSSIQTSSSNYTRYSRTTLVISSSKMIETTLTGALRVREHFLISLHLMRRRRVCSCKSRLQTTFLLPTVKGLKNSQSA